MSVSVVRLLVGDIPQRARFEATGDGVLSEYDLPEHPLLSAPRVVIDGVVQTITTDYTIDLQLGVLQFDTAPEYDAPIVVTYSWAQFTDADLQTYLDIESGDPRLAAADALDAIASSAAMLQGRITMLDITLDGTAVAKALHETAMGLRAVVEAGAVPVPTDENPGFDFAEMVFDSNRDEKVRAEILRGW